MNLNKNIKVFFIDLDGTLLDTKKDGYHAITKDNMDEIKKMKQSGVHIVVSTGRSGGQAARYLDMVKSEYAVTGNGSIILKNNKVIKETFMSIRQVIMIRDIALEEKVVIKLDDSRDAYGSKSFIQKYVAEKCDEHGWHYIIGFEPEEPEDISDLEKMLNPAKPVKSIKVNRNEPCPCGSGKKHKKCCGGN